MCGASYEVCAAKLCCVCRAISTYVCAAQNAQFWTIFPLCVQSMRVQSKCLSVCAESTRPLAHLASPRIHAHRASQPRRQLYFCTLFAPFAIFRDNLWDRENILAFFKSTSQTRCPSSERNSSLLISCRASLVRSGASSASLTTTRIGRSSSVMRPTLWCLSTDRDSTAGSKIFAFSWRRSAPKRRSFRRMHRDQRPPRRPPGDLHSGAAKLPRNVFTRRITHVPHAQSARWRADEDAARELVEEPLLDGHVLQRWIRDCPEEGGEAERYRRTWCVGRRCGHGGGYHVRCE